MADVADFRNLIGLTEREAENILAARNGRLRVVHRDGMELAQTSDCLPWIVRVNVAVGAGRVSEIVSVG